MLKIILVALLVLSGLAYGEQKDCESALSSDVSTTAERFGVTSADLLKNVEYWKGKLSIKALSSGLLGLKPVRVYPTQTQLTELAALQLVLRLDDETILQLRSVLESKNHVIENLSAGLFDILNAELGELNQYAIDKNTKAIAHIFPDESEKHLLLASYARSIARKTGVTDGALLMEAREALGRFSWNAEPKGFLRTLFTNKSIPVKPNGFQALQLAEMIITGNIDDATATTVFYQTRLQLAELDWTNSYYVDLFYQRLIEALHSVDQSN